MGIEVVLVEGTHLERIELVNKVTRIGDANPTQFRAALSEAGRMKEQQHGSGCQQPKHVANAGA